MNMEYRVYLPKLRQSAGQLEQVARKQRQTYDSLRETIARLRRLSYMEPVITVLSRKRRELEEELQKILRMAQSLRRIEQTYREMEERIIDGLELPAGGWEHRPPLGPWVVVPPQPPRPPYYPPRPPHQPPRPPIDPWDRNHFYDIIRHWWRTRYNPWIHDGPWRYPRPWYRDRLTSPLWVRLNGRDPEPQRCCPVVNVQVIRAAATPIQEAVPTEILENNEVVVRLASVPAADS